MTLPLTHSCALCTSPAVSVINEVWCCPSHLEEALKFAIHVEALEKGIDPRKAESAVMKAFKQMGCE